MSEHPLIFQDWGIRAIMSDQKTNTRRIGNRYRNWKKGDLIWCKETFALNISGCPKGITYRADHQNPKGDGPVLIKWKSSLFMPRLASRLILRMTADAREERLQDITEEDAEKEGIICVGFSGLSFCKLYSVNPLADPKKHYDSPNEGTYDTAKMCFSDLWDSINSKKYSWESNPFVWVIQFKGME